jgi:hypothetical protein
MDPQAWRDLRRLLDRQAILDCVTQFSRAVDRFDRELALAAFHPDAIADYGPLVGSREALYDWAVVQAPQQISTHHYTTNHICEIDGDTAHAETYFLYVCRRIDNTLWAAGGRYLDRLERRDGAWRISTRYATAEWAGSIAETAVPFADIPDVHTNGAPSRDRTDPSYRRPLVNRRKPRVLGE